MKVVFVSGKGAVEKNRRFLRAISVYSMLQQLPCKFIRCSSAIEVQREVDAGADVVILSRPNLVPFRDQLTFLNDLPIFVARTYVDAWHPIEQDSGDIRFDAFFVTYYTSSKRALPERANKMYFVPPSCDLPNCDQVPRDIDILFWGRGDYPIRQQMIGWVTKRVVEKGPGESNLCIRVVAINNRKYKCAHLPWGMVYMGEDLLELLSRVKICITGVPQVIVGPNPAGCYYPPVGKYFENSAAGAVTITNEFTDRETLGFKHKENIWVVEEGCFVDEVHEDEFMAALTYLLEHDDVREEMSTSAKALISTRHTRKVRAQEVYDLLCKLTGRG